MEFKRIIPRFGAAVSRKLWHKKGVK